MVDQTNRLDKGGRINRDKKVMFTFNGKRYAGYEGDTLASALLANNVHLVGRSFKYHRPRGIFTAGVEEQSALVQLGPDRVRTEPNVRSTQIEVYDDLVAEPQNAIPSVKFDLMGFNERIWALLPAGFYYKTFMWPVRLWEFYETFIRRAAGMGKAPQGPDPDRYDHMHDHCDVLIAGGGVTGIAAALSAAKSGARVILADEQAEFGGWVLNEGEETLQIEGKPASEWAAEKIEDLRGFTNVTLLPKTTVFGNYNDNYITLHQRVQDHVSLSNRDPNMARQRIWKVRAKKLIMATGMIERHLLFNGNDLPGIMLAGAVRTYVNRYGVCPGRRAVVVTNNNSAYQSALDLHAAGAHVAGIIDTRANPQGDLVTKAREAGLDIYAGHSVTTTQGFKRIKSVTARQIDDNGGVKGDPVHFDCDLLAVSGGWNPSVHLLSQIKGPLAYNDELQSFMPKDRVHKDTICAGACNATTGLQSAIEEGAKAGADAARLGGFEADAEKTPGIDRDFDALNLTMTWVLPSDVEEKKFRAFVDIQNDVTTKDLKLALREGYTSVEHVKRYTTTGMGTDQGKTGNVLALGMLAQQMGKDVPEIGFTTFRPPYSPITLGAIAGRHTGDLFVPVRKTPMHDWHAENGAVFEDVGQWKRPFCYPRKGESEHDAVQREAKAVRDSVGVLDASTLGKIDIQGPDAGEFLNRIYTNGWTKLAVGKCRYGLMLGEDGMVMDDGVTARISENHYHMTTTSGGAAKVMAWLEEWHQTEWPDLRVSMTSVTDQWAVASMAGPNARNVIEKLVDDIDVGPDDMKFMTWKQGHVCGGIPARVFRISFSGESGFEINVPATYGRYMWERVMEAGAPFDITPYGTEVMHLLRAEKGFIIVGQDTDGTITPHDLNMDWIVSSKKDFIGKRSLYREDMLRGDRKKLVGLKTRDAHFVIPEGAHVLNKDAGHETPIPMQGHVTSSYYSPVLQRSVALALVKGGLDRKGETLIVDTGESRASVEIVDPVFYDKEGERFNA